MINTDLTFETLKYLKLGDEVLDLGSGRGIQAKEFLKAGMIVEAVDKIKLENIDNRIIWHQKKIEDFIITNDKKYNLIFIKNIIQFLDKEWVKDIFISKIKVTLKKDGLIAIRTFYNNPEPNFLKSVASLYELNELLKEFKDYKIILSNQYEKIGPDLKGSTRKFYLVDLIVKKN